jgi:hypothetical protein
MSSVDPSVWGPGGWALLHRMSFAMTDVADARNFYAVVGHILPCTKCRNNYRDHIARYPFPTKMREIPEWVYDLHNRVRRRTRKVPEGVPSLDEVKRLYTGYEHTVQPMEWVFLKAVCAVHPGVYRASPAYIDALYSFLVFWCQYSSLPIPTRSIVEKKTFLLDWFMKLKKGTKTPVMNKCSQDVCSL